MTNIMDKYIVGFDIGGTKCAVNLAVVNKGIKFIDKIVFPTEAEKGYEYVISNLCTSGKTLLRNNNFSSDNISALGISFGGAVDIKTGVVFSPSPPHLPGWENVPIRHLLSREFGVQAYIQNDANACALVEWLIGSGRGTRDMVFITMGTGFGAGIIAGGQLIEGACSLAGEIGHLRLESDGPVMYGKAGSVEAYCSGEGISLTFGAGRDVKSIAASARGGDEDSIEVFRKTGAKLGKALAILVDLLNPECIVIGSIYSRCEDLLKDSMQKALLEEALPQAAKACRIVPAQTGEQIGDYASILTACYGMGIKSNDI